jgi:hypothetical protein
MNRGANEAGGVSLAEGKIGPDELSLVQIADDPDEVVKIIKTAHAGLTAW